MNGSRHILSVLWTAALLGLSCPAALAEREAGDTFDVDGRLLLNAYEGMVEQHLGGVLTGLKGLAATAAARSGDWKHLKGPLAAFGAGVATAAAIWWARPDGTYFTVEKGLVAASLSDRSYFPTLMQGRDIDGTLVISKSTGERSVIVAAPIEDAGKVVGALGVSLSVPKLSAQVNRSIRFPHNVVFYALDPHGRTALHKESALIFDYPSDVGTPSLKSSVKTMLSRPRGSVHYVFRGTARTVIFDRSKATGWVFALGRAQAG